jgi:prevent-host-death family protein
MTPQRRGIKREVGIRELHDQLSRYMRHVAAGDEVFVTMRGKRIARLSPVDGTDPLEDLRRRGLIQEPSRNDWRPRRRGRPAPSAPVADLVSDQRR